MKAEWKYVVYRDDAGDEVIETFGVAVLHKDFVQRAGIALERLISAGFVTRDRECFGASTSLSLNSRPRQDTALLRDE
jgi:hypothetical protein